MKSFYEILFIIYMRLFLWNSWRQIKIISNKTKSIFMKENKTGTSVYKIVIRFDLQDRQQIIFLYPQSNFDLNYTCMNRCTLETRQTWARMNLYTCIANLKKVVRQKPYTLNSKRAWIRCWVTSFSTSGILHCNNAKTCD